MGDRPNDIDLNIQELVVHGCQAVDAAGIGAVLQRELARLTANHESPTVRTETAGSAGLNGTGSGEGSRIATEAVGIQVAQAVFRRVKSCRQDRS